MTKVPEYKSVKLRADTQWPPVAQFAKELSEEMGMSVSLPDAITFAIKFTNENRKRPINAAGTPGGSGTGESSHA